MLRPNSRKRPVSKWAWRFAATLAILAQCWIAVAPLSDSRGFGQSAHVEALGNHASHYTHDEATCAACSVLSLHILTSAPAAVPAPPGQPVLKVATVTVAWVAPPPVHSRQPRAPPSSV